MDPTDPLYSKRKFTNFGFTYKSSSPDSNWDVFRQLPLKQPSLPVPPEEDSPLRGTRTLTIRVITGLSDPRVYQIPPQVDNEIHFSRTAPFNQLGYPSSYGGRQDSNLRRRIASSFTDRGIAARISSRDDRT